MWCVLRLLALLWALIGVVQFGCATLARGGIRVTVRNKSGRDMDCRITAPRSAVERYVGPGNEVVEYLHPAGHHESIAVAVRDGQTWATRHDSGANFDVFESGDVDCVIHSDGSVTSEVCKGLTLFGAPSEVLTRECEAPQLLVFLLPVAVLLLFGMSGKGRPAQGTPS